jgi:threonine aldolase
LLEALKSQGVLATGLIGLRFVTHLGVDAAGIEHALTCIRRFMQTSADEATQGLSRSGVY